MNINIDQFKENIRLNAEALLDRVLLSNDMITLMDYYNKNPQDCPEHLVKFVSEPPVYLTDFTLAYLGNIVDKKLSYTSTEDGWVKIFVD